MMLQIRSLKMSKQSYKPLIKKTHSSETAMIKCRVEECKLEMLKKNYRQHIENAHSAENPNDLSPYGQGKIANFFTKDIKNEVKKEDLGPPPKSTKLNTGEDTTLNDSEKLSVLLQEVREIKKRLENTGNVAAPTQTKRKVIAKLPTIISDKFLCARSIHDIENLGFEYENKSVLRCIICITDDKKDGVFEYSDKNGVDFSCSPFSSEFKNLKKHVRRHMSKSKLHVKNDKSVL